MRAGDRVSPGRRARRIGHRVRALTLSVLLGAAVAAGPVAPAVAAASASQAAPQAMRPGAVRTAAAAKPRTAAKTPPRGGQRWDHSGRKRVGLASYYAPRFAGRRMADGTPMRPHGDNAASRTLPLGTVAVVTNLENGRQALVTIRDRGPYVRGRIIDVSPATARKLAMLDDGVVRVEVAPLRVPLPGGGVKVVDAAAQQPDS